MIKQLVVSGGDITYFSMLGIIKTMKNELNNLEEIFAVSCGSWIGLCLSLKIDIDIIINYFIERPWEKLFNFNSDKFFKLYDSLGIYDVNIFHETFKPLLKMCNLDINITMKELYEYSNIKLNIYATKYSDLSYCCFNYEISPNLKVMDALFMSSSIPILFKPLKYNNEYYVDGGYNCNYPIIECLKKNKNKSEILGIETVCFNDLTVITEDENVFSFYIKLFYKFVLNKQLSYNIDNNINKIIIDYDLFTIERFMNVINNEQDRVEMIQNGVNCAKTYIEYNNQRVD
jgi:predicted acylesterase/phospholipase RssA